MATSFDAVTVHLKMRWWVQPLIRAVRAYVWLSGRGFDVDRFAKWIIENGVSIRAA